MNGGSVTIRLADACDAAAVRRLAALDSAPAPRGEVLIAEVDGAALAALSLERGAAIADPFQLTGDVLALLSMRAAQLAARADGKPDARQPAALAAA